MSEDIKKLYQRVLLEHQNQGFEKHEQAQHVLEAYNPVCGDQFKIYLDLSDGLVSHASFHGYGCAISKASTSLLITSLLGKSIDECQQILKYFNDCMEGTISSPPELYAALAMSKHFPGRHQCATLSWNTFEEFLKKQ